MKDYKALTQQYYDAIRASNYEFDPLYRQRLHRQLSLKSAVSRLQSLQSKIEWQIEQIYAEQQTRMTQGLKQDYEASYYKTLYNVQQAVGFGSPFATLDAKTINSAVAQYWVNDGLQANYSDRIWRNKDRLLQALSTEIPQGFILGHNPRKIARTLLGMGLGTEGTEDAKTPMRTAYRRLERLARTEFNHIANDASVSAYEAVGLEMYEYLATLDNKTSAICQALDGKKFKLEDRKVGVNFPPLHPNCRSTTIPYFPPDEIDAMFAQATRIAKSPDTGKYYHVPADMPYKEWQKVAGVEMITK